MPAILTKALLPYAMPTSHPISHVFIDFENVPAITLTGFAGGPVRLTILLGEKQKRLDSLLVEQLLQYSANVNFVRLRSSGRNALDFTLAYSVGRAVAADPTAEVYIISHDKGFDPLIEHLNLNRIKAARHEDFQDLPFLERAKRSGSAARLAEVVAHLAAHPDSRPKRLRTLLSHLQANYGHLTEAEAEAMVDELRDRNFITIDVKGAVIYQLPNETLR